MRALGKISAKRAPISSCTVTLLALEFDALNKAYDEQDSLDDRRQMMILWDRMSAIRDQVSYMRPESKLGAAFQIMLAASQLDALTDVGGETQRELEAEMGRLFFRAVEYLMTGDDRISSAREFCMSPYLDPQTLLQAIKETIPDRAC